MSPDDRWWNQTMERTSRRAQTWGVRRGLGCGWSCRSRPPSRSVQSSVWTCEPRRCPVVRGARQARGRSARRRRVHLVRVVGATRPSLRISRPRLERGRFKRPRLLHAAARASRMGSHPSRAISPVHGEKRDASSRRRRVGPPSVEHSIAPLDNGGVLLAPGAGLPLEPRSSFVSTRTVRAPLPRRPGASLDGDCPGTDGLDLEELGSSADLA
jgi:hypothetical protein